jgi:TolB protein
VLGVGLRRALEKVLSAIWAFLGRMGLALRNLLTWFFWQPLLFITWPWRLVYRRWIHRRLMGLVRRIGRAIFWVWRQLARLVGWLLVRHFRALWRRLRARWREERAGRRYRLRRLHSHWMVFRARLRVSLKQPRPPRRAEVAPTVPRAKKRPTVRRATRWATTVLALGLVGVASVLTAQQAPQINRVVAQADYHLRSSKFTAKPTARPTTVAQPTATPNASPTPWPTPDPLNSGGSVAFTLRANGHSDIYGLSIGQSQPVRLTNHPADDRDPAWSPDGRRLAFASRREGNWDLYVLNLPDGRLQRLTDDVAFDAGPSWSPDGQWLVYESYRQGNLDLYLISADGEQGPLRLTQHPAPDFSPAWSPIGRHVAFTSWRSGNKDIFVLSLDEAADAAALNVTSAPNRQEDHAAFNPDASALAYSEDSTGFELVYVLPLSGYRPSGEPASRGQGRHPTWSPDGQALSYIHVKDGQSHLIASSLDAWSVAPQAFTTGGRLDDPNWSARTLPLPLPEHLETINQAVDDPFFVETVFPPREEGAPYLLQEVSINAPAPYLNDRVDQSFLTLRRQVQEEAGWDFLGEVDNLFEPLEAGPSPGQSARTWNKAGRAFDYISDHALASEPQVEVVREDRGYQLYWRTYLRASVQDGSQGEPLRDLPWDFRARYGAEPRFYDQGGKWKEAIPAGYFVDFTTLAADYGWRPVPSGDNWRTYFPGVRFWHYEKRQDLNWEQAMLEIYTPDQILEQFGQ